jgi:hypothetical protein
LAPDKVLADPGLFGMFEEEVPDRGGLGRQERCHGGILAWGREKVKKDLTKRHKL